jgi:alpha/beta hydrolase family protein
VPGAGDLPGKGLKKLDPARYGSLQHPGDGYAFDIYTQVTRALRKGGAPLGGAKPKFVVAAGESQSAIALTTYYDGVQPLTLVFDGFLIHSRGGASLPLVGPGQFADLAGSLGSTLKPIFRDDLDAPVMDIQTESDTTGILSSAVVRQPDTDLFRLWEVTGTSHADAHLLGPMASSIDCGAPINNGPMHLVAKAAFRDLDTWVRTGELPPVAPRIELTSAAMPEVQRDGDGIALGGIRTPPIDVPVDVLSAVPGPNPAVICLLLGSTQPLPDARLAELYPSRDAYVQQYDAATDQVIQSGFVLEADRAAMLAFSQPSRIEP